MKKRKIVGIAALIGAASSLLTSCTPERFNGLYGPPPDNSRSDIASDSGEEVIPVPEENIPEDVYGPPSMFGIDEDEQFRPEDNDPEEVYGPPEWFGGQEEDEPYDPAETEEDLAEEDNTDE